jgi:hypothetical protein
VERRGGDGPSPVRIFESAARGDEPSPPLLRARWLNIFEIHGPRLGPANERRDVCGRDGSPLSGQHLCCSDSLRRPLARAVFSSARKPSQPARGRRGRARRGHRSAMSLPRGRIRGFIGLIPLHFGDPILLKLGRRRGDGGSIKQRPPASPRPKPLNAKAEFASFSSSNQTLPVLFFMARFMFLRQIVSRAVGQMLSNRTNT